jgi:hypothetical protein
MERDPSSNDWGVNVEIPLWMKIASAKRDSGYALEYAAFYRGLAKDAVGDDRDAFLEAVDMHEKQSADYDREAAELESANVTQVPNTGV